MVLLVALCAALVVWTQNWQTEEQSQNERTREAEALAQGQAEKTRMAFPLPSEPSIAVLPFMNLSDDAEQEYVTDGVTNDIITDLSRFSTLFVIASNSTFRYKGQAVKVQQVAEDLGVRYVLEGSVQRLGDTLRINAQLVDALSGRHVWVFIANADGTGKAVKVWSGSATGVDWGPAPKN
jgi:TolB-like protein